MGRDAARAPVPRSGRAVARPARSATPLWRKPAMSGHLAPRSALGLVLLALVLPTAVEAGPEEWRRGWPHTDFSLPSVAFGEIFSGGPPKAGLSGVEPPPFAARSPCRDL